MTRIVVGCAAALLLFRGRKFQATIRVTAKGSTVARPLTGEIR
jgi:hypothetical protein